MKFPAFRKPSEANPPIPRARGASRARGVFRAPACIAFSRERHRLRLPVAPVRQALVRMLTSPILSAGKSTDFHGEGYRKIWARLRALPGFARALAACAG